MPPSFNDYLIQKWEQARGYLSEDLGTLRIQIGRQAQTFIVGTVPFANLPQSPVTGSLITVTDSTTNTWGATISGGGSNQVLAYFNGTHWTVVGK